MENDLSIEKEAGLHDNRGAGGNSANYPLNANNGTPNEVPSDNSTEPLGTPSERLQMLQLECRHGAESGLPVHFGYRVVGNVPQLYILVTNVTECPSCHWWQFDGVCDNHRCRRYQQRNVS